MKINFKRIAFWLLGIALICFGISFFLFHRAGIGIDSFENISVEAESAIAHSRTSSQV